MHLEHILPQTLSSEWREGLPDGGEAHPDMVGRWGNLTLLDAGLNIKGGNRPFEAKQRDAYQMSVLSLNEPLKVTSAWDYDAIEQRQAWLAEHADIVWDMGRFIDLTQRRPAGTDPAPAASSLVDGLPPAIASIFEPLCQETAVEEFSELRAAIDKYLGTVEIEAAQRVERPTGQADEVAGGSGRPQTRTASGRQTRGTKLPVTMGSTRDCQHNAMIESCW